MTNDAATGPDDRLGEIIQSLMELEGPLLPILHAVQHAYGHIPSTAVGAIALALNLSRAEVHGVVTFYEDFRTTPPGRHVLRLCRAEACQARGGQALADDIQARFQVEMGATSADGELTLEPVYCLGLCASGPAAFLDGAPIARLTTERLSSLLGEIA